MPLTIASGVDMLFHDAQYFDDEYPSHVGWGHSAVSHTVALARRADARRVVLFHHDPSHDDNTLERLLDDAVRRFKPAFRVSGGREGAVFELGSRNASAA